MKFFTSNPVSVNIVQIKEQAGTDKKRKGKKEKEKKIAVTSKREQSNKQITSNQLKWSTMLIDMMILMRLEPMPIDMH